MSSLRQSDLDVLLAQQFADAINDGTVTVQDCWEQCWSYEEDAGLWGYAGRALLPAWKPYLMRIYLHLDGAASEQLIGCLINAQQSAPSPSPYYPFLDDVLFAAELHIVAGAHVSKDAIVATLQRTILQDERIGEVRDYVCCLLAGERVAGEEALRGKQHIAGIIDVERKAWDGYAERMVIDECGVPTDLMRIDFLPPSFWVPTFIPTIYGAAPFQEFFGCDIQQALASEDVAAQRRAHHYCYQVGGLRREDYRDALAFGMRPDFPQREGETVVSYDAQRVLHHRVRPSALTVMPHD